MSHQGLSIRPRLLAASVASALGISGAFVAPAHAQDGQEVLLEEVVVTGSRIVRRDYQSSSPIVTVERDAFEQQSGLNIESYLNQLPQYNPAASPVTTQQDVQITPVNSVGIASISLRGFGPNRSLVLVDGKRTVPINALMVTDINSIPSALIERVETITGGASAVYGADAVGGVTNFILRDDFEGFDIDFQHGATQEGDGEESRVSVVFGTNFADGRGNVTFGLESYNRNEALEINHDRYRERWLDPAVPGWLFVQGVNGFNCNTSAGPNCPDAAVVDALFFDRPTRTGPDVGDVLPLYQIVSMGFSFNADGTVFTQNRGGIYRYNGPINEEYALRDNLDIFASPPQEWTGLKWNNPYAFISGPQERKSFFAAGNFDLTDNVRVFARSTFAESKTRTVLAGTNVTAGWEFTIPYDPAVDSPIPLGLDLTDPDLVADIRANPDAYLNPTFIPTGAEGAHFPVPLDLAILLNSRPNPAAPWQPDWNPAHSLPPRNTYNTNAVWQLEAGLEFDVGRNWGGELYFSHGESSTYNVAGGNLSLERVRRLLSEPDYGRNAEISGNENSVRPNFGAADITCGSGFYDTLFRGDQRPDQDCVDAITAQLQTRSENVQQIVELNFQGPLFELPAGEVLAAVGYQKRRNKALFYPDILQSTVSFTDQVVGVYPTGYLDASTSVDDYYFETLIPLLQGKTGAQRLELELGVRYSDYEHVEEETTWKSLVNWQINDWVRLRGGFNRATRAPNLGELFLNPQEIFTAGGNFGDPCGVRSNAPWGARGVQEDPQLFPWEQPVLGNYAPGQTEQGAESTKLICQELMGGAGSLAANRFYDESDASGDGGGPFAWVIQEGNPNLKSETADTWTFGFVMNSPFDSPWLSGGTLAFDWYKVDIKDAIMLYSLDWAAYQCFGTRIVTNADEAREQAATDACQRHPRDLVSGVPLNTWVTYDNLGTIETAGFDAQVNWFLRLPELGMELPGTIGLNLQATVLDYYRTRSTPGFFDPEIEWAGSLGPQMASTNSGAYDYRLFGTLSYTQNNWSVSLRWRHLPSVWTAGYARQQALVEHNQSVAAGAEGIYLLYTPSTEIETDSYNVFDLAFNWNINEMLTFRGGITNLFDTDPKLTGRTTGYPVGTDFSAVCGDAPGCNNPTSPSLPGAGSFSAGYYDTLGRRFFLGLNVRF